MFLTLVFLFLLSSLVSADIWVESPARGSRLMSVNTTLLVFNNESLTNCTYSINEFVREPCVFNTSNNITSFFGWNRLSACGTNSSGGEVCASTLSFWSDKRDKSVSDYFVLASLLVLGLFFSAGGLVSFGFMGVIGGVLLFVSALESISLGVNSLAYTLFLLSIMALVGSVIKK